MPAIAPIAYATTADLFGAQGYVRDPSQANSPIATTLLNVASRFIDEKCGRFFYDGGQYRRFFDGGATREVTIWPDLWGAVGTIAAAVRGATTLTFTAGPNSPPPSVSDVLAVDIGTNYEQVTVAAVSGIGPYTLTVSATAFGHPAATIVSAVIPSLAYYENQPFSQWLSVQGDGVSAGNSNFFLKPTDPKPYLTTGSQFAAPWYGFDMPAIPVSNTAYLPTPRPGSRTIAITAHWGWPAVPELIRDLCLKMGARAWLARQDAWAHTSGDATMGTMNMSHHFDSRDEALLIESGYVRLAV